MADHNLLNANQTADKSPKKVFVCRLRFLFKKIIEHLSNNSEYQMKTIKITFYIFLFIQFIFPVQNHAKFIWQNISADEKEILLVDSLNFYLVGDDGKILRSYDGGAKWEWQESYIRANLMSVSFIDLNNGFAVGDSGYVLSTRNSGKTWTSKKVGNKRLFAVKMIDNNNIFAVGDRGVIYKTTDGGKNWNLKYENDSTCLKRIKFIDDKTGYAVGEHNFAFKTIDGGDNWTSLFQSHSKYFQLCAVDFFDINHGVIGGMDSLSHLALTYKTTDGGLTWDTVKLDLWEYWVGAKMYSSQKVLLFGWGGVLKTDDFFKTFSISTLTTKDYLNVNPQPILIKSISALGNGTIYYLGFNHSIVKSTDYGNTFKFVNWFDMTVPPSMLYMKGLVCLNDNECLFYGETGHIFRSVDGGTLWNYVYPSDSSNYYLKFKGSNLSAHHFISEKVGFLVGYRQNQPPKYLKDFTIFTSDGGITWTANDKIKAYSMSFPEDEFGFAVADSNFSKTTDGGETWFTKSLFSKKCIMTFSKVDFKTKDVGYIHGRQTKYPTEDTINFPYRTAYRVLKTTNGGDSFDTIATVGNSRLYVDNGYFKDKNNGFLFGSGYDMLVTTDGGQNWNWQKLDTNKHRISSMKFFDSENGIAGALNDTVFTTTDGGKNWICERIPAKSGWSAICDYSGITIKNKDTVFLFGYNRLIRGVKMPDSLNIVKETVNIFNPYFFISIAPNPVSNIVKFKIYGLYSVKDSPLSFKILDIFGDEVLDLSAYANDNNNGSTSEFNYNISSLPLGVYIVKLSSMGYVHVLKLVKT